MDRSSLRPLANPIRADMEPAAAEGTEGTRPPASPKPRRLRPGWRPVIVRAETFDRLRALQKSTRDPAVDLSYLCDACVQLALERGVEAIVMRALADLQPKSASSEPNHSSYGALS